MCELRLISVFQEEKGRLQTEVKAGLGQVQEKDAEIKRLQREIRTLRVCDILTYTKLIQD